MVTVFQGIREARRCVWCGGPLVRNQTKFCGNTCKAKGHAFKESLDRLAQLPEPEFRELLRGVLRKRFGMLGKVRRYHIRFGEYQESLEDPELRELRLATWREIDPEVGRFGSIHVWQGNVARRLSWIAQYLRLLDRGAKAGRERREREARHGAA